ncbi:hypothetical protein OIO90_006358 [Microbotryomycetes sp. JL221]|nr:hypothetical protein OIO90_006358 [Microbotryomycetes sp. JL221]
MASQELISSDQYKEIVDKYDNFLFDLDGVVWEGDHVIEGAPQALEYLRRAGKRLFFVTNNATKSRESNKAKFDKMGIECQVDEIFSSAWASAAYLKNVLKFPDDKKVYVVGEKGIEDELDLFGIKHSGGTSPEDNVFIDLMDFSSITADPEVGAVLCGLDMHFNYKKIARAFKYLRENEVRPGEPCLFVATNLDSTFPTHGSIYPGGGATTAPLTCALGRDPITVGKPEKAMLDSIIQTHNIDKSRTLMVGDRLNTDILFGNRGGIDTMMVLTGINTKADFEKEDAVARPTYPYLPGYDDDKLYKRRVTRRQTTIKRVLKLVVVILALVGIILWKKYEIHIEVQVYSRGWVSRAIKAVEPLSSTCFDRSQIAATAYPTDLANSPKHVQVHSGLSMQLGDDCYNFAQTIPAKLQPGMEISNHTTFHLYWRTDLLPISDRQVILLDSILAMQDREQTSVILWTNAREPEVFAQSVKIKPVTDRYRHRFTVKYADKELLAQGTPMQNHDMLHMADDKAWLDGDLIRILVLWSYGGVWVDMDTIMTGRSVLPLLESEWVTQWDCYDKMYQPLNGAMMHFFVNSPFLCEMMFTMANGDPPRKGTVDWGSRLYHKGEGPGGLWLCSGVMQSSNASITTHIDPPDKHDSSNVKNFLVAASVAGTTFLNKDLGFTPASLQWPVALYSLVLGALLLPSGQLSDVFGHRRMFLAGTMLYFAISLGVALAPNVIGFSALCALLGLAAAANTPAGPLGFIAGLIVGALLTERAGWRATYYIQAGLGALFGVIAFFAIPSEFATESAAIPLTEFSQDDATRPHSATKVAASRGVDWVGSLLSIAGLVLLTFALADASSEPRGWKTPFLPPMIPVSLALLAAFFYWETRLAQQVTAFQESVATEQADSKQQRKPPPPPLLAPAIWRAPHVAGILAIVFFSWAAFNTSTYYINLVLQLVMAVSPIKTALYFLPMIISGTILNFVPAFLMSRFSGRIIVNAAMMLSIVAPVMLACIDVKASYWQFLFPIMLMSPATDIVFPICTIQISKSVSRSSQATAGALFNVTIRLATSMSLAIISSVANAASVNYLTAHPDNGLTSDSPEVLLVGYRLGAWLCVGKEE